MNLMFFLFLFIILSFALLCVLVKRVNESPEALCLSIAFASAFVMLIYFTNTYSKEESIIIETSSKYLSTTTLDSTSQDIEKSILQQLKTLKDIPKRDSLQEIKAIELSNPNSKLVSINTYVGKNIYLEKNLKFLVSYKNGNTEVKKITDIQTEELKQDAKL